MVGRRFVKRGETIIVGRDATDTLTRRPNVTQRACCEQHLRAPTVCVRPFVGASWTPDHCGWLLSGDRGWWLAEDGPRGACKVSEKGDCLAGERGHLVQKMKSQKEREQQGTISGTIEKLVTVYVPSGNDSGTNPSCCQMIDRQQQQSAPHELTGSNSGGCSSMRERHCGGESEFDENFDFRKQSSNLQQKSAREQVHQLEAIRKRQHLEHLKHLEHLEHLKHLEQVEQLRQPLETDSPRELTTNGPLSSIENHCRAEKSTPRWPVGSQRVQLLIIYIALTSLTLTSWPRVCSAAASNEGPQVITSNFYWPTSILSSRFSLQPPRVAHSRRLETGAGQPALSPNGEPLRQVAPAGGLQRASNGRPQLRESSHASIRSLVSAGSARRSLSAAAASAAAAVATANAALARRGQSKNLIIGQNFNNFSSAIPYSVMMQDVDYSTGQEDPIINEPAASHSAEAPLPPPPLLWAGHTSELRAPTPSANSNRAGQAQQEVASAQGAQRQPLEQADSLAVSSAGGGGGDLRAAPASSEAQLFGQPALVIVDQQMQVGGGSASGSMEEASQVQQTLQQQQARQTNSVDIASVPQEAASAGQRAWGAPSNRKQEEASDRALLPLDSGRLMLPQMQQIKARFNQGCVGGTKCQFFAFCWMSGGSLGASCGLLMTCCVTPSRQEIQPGFFGPVVNDPCK